MARRVVFLDRDGTLNVDRGFVHRIRDWQFTDRAPEAVKLLRDRGYAVAVVTNQSGIARGYYTLRDVDVLHDYVQKELAKRQTQLDVITFCPHGPEDNCICGKPATGMLKIVEAALGEPIDFEASWMVGDKLSDVEFGARLGTRKALLRSRYWDAEYLGHSSDVVGDMLFEVTQEIVAKE